MEGDLIYLWLWRKGKLLGESVHRELWEIVERVLWKRSISLFWRSVRGNWRGAPLLGTLKVMYKEVLVMGISFHRGPVGEPGGGFFYRELWDTVIFGLLFLGPEGVRRLSLAAVWNCCEGPLRPWLCIRVWSTKALSKGIGALRPKGLKPNYYSTLPYSTLPHKSFNPPKYRVRRKL